MPQRAQYGSTSFTTAQQRGQNGLTVGGADGRFGGPGGSLGTGPNRGWSLPAVLGVPQAGQNRSAFANTAEQLLQRAIPVRIGHHAA
jgi:hypothetical protein